jgi:hypothetical protein
MQNMSHIRAKLLAHVKVGAAREKLLFTREYLFEEGFGDSCRRRCLSEPPEPDRKIECARR